MQRTVDEHEVKQLRFVKIAQVLVQGHDGMRDARRPSPAQCERCLAAIEHDDVGIAAGVDAANERQQSGIRRPRDKEAAPALGDQRRQHGLQIGRGELHACRGPRQPYVRP
jgi:hypothetical protein